MGFTARTWNSGGKEVLVITIPKKTATAYQIKKGDYLDVEIKKIPKPTKIN